eukprot:6199027-Pleurochrysis_carterae.AAC.2
MVQVFIDQRISSLMLATALPYRSEGSAGQQANVRRHLTPNASAHNDYDRDATQSSFQHTLGFWRQLEEKARFLLADTPYSEPCSTAVEPRNDTSDHAHVLNSDVGKDVSCSDTLIVTAAALQPV